MKLTREEFRDYIHSYENDELFYKDLYFQEKNHPETFEKYCHKLDPALISRHRLFVPLLHKEDGRLSSFEPPVLKGRTVWGSGFTSDL